MFCLILFFGATIIRANAIMIILVEAIASVKVMLFRFAPRKYQRSIEYGKYHDTYNKYFAFHSVSSCYNSYNNSVIVPIIIVSDNF